MTDHSIFAPSSLGLLYECPGSWAMSRTCPPEIQIDPLADAEGTAAHSVATLRAALGMQLPVGAPTTTPHPEGGFVEVTTEMIDGAMLWQEECSKYPGGLHETRVDIPSVAPECFGTPDYQWYSPDQIVNLDYKFGHIDHDPYGHWQSLGYVAAPIEAHRVPDPTPVRIVIVQPRSYGPAGPVKTWDTNAGEVRRRIALLRDKIQLARQPDAPLVAGAHCRFCPARLHCEVNRRDVGEVSGLSRNGPECHSLTPVQLGAELRVLEQAMARTKARADGITAALEAHLRAGERVPGWRLEDKLGRLDWAWKPKQVVDYGNMLGVDLRSDKVAVITPTQAAAVMKRAGLPALPKNASSRPHRGMTLAQVDYTRTQRIFQKVEQ